MTSRKSTSTDHAAVLSFEYDDGERARCVERAVRPEVDEIDGDRSSVRLDRTGSTLELAVEATDLIALRAGLNTWFSLVTVAERAGGVVQ